MPTIRDVAAPLHTLDPEAPDESDLEALRAVVGDARVVCIGESAHFTSEFSLLHDRVLRFLVRELGFSAFVLESGLPEGLAVDEWVRGGAGDLAEIARNGITWSLGRCAEMHDQLRWMREHNRTASPVRFYGMDVPGWCVNPAPGVAGCLARIPARAGDSELLATADLGTPEKAPAPDATESDSAGSDAAGSDATGTVPDGLQQRIDELVERAESAADPLASRCAHGARSVLEFRRGGLYPAPGRNLRNEVMAENLRCILEREDRIVVAAHNVHLQRTAAFDGTAAIGGLLGAELGEDLVVIGTTRGSGIVPDVDLDAEPSQRFTTPAGRITPPPHSLDAVLGTADLPHHLLDLRRTTADLLAGVTCMAGQDHLLDIDPRRAFDAVIHVRQITPARGTAD